LLRWVNDIDGGVAEELYSGDIEYVASWAVPVSEIQRRRRWGPVQASGLMLKLESPPRGRVIGVALIEASVLGLQFGSRYENIRTRRVTCRIGHDAVIDEVDYANAPPRSELEPVKFPFT